MKNNLFSMDDNEILERLIEIARRMYYEEKQKHEQRLIKEVYWLAGLNEPYRRIYEQRGYGER